MELLGSDSSLFELEILGYQFPGIVGEEHDSNWLLVRVRVNSSGRSWQAEDPCLLTWEVARLADWLEDECIKGEPSECGFLEPNLEFEVLLSAGRSLVLRVYFELEMRPDRRKFCAGERDCFVEFAIAELDLRAAANDLRQQLTRFPERK